MSTCKNCQAEVSARAKFCSRCGAIQANSKDLALEAETLRQSQPATFDTIAQTVRVVPARAGADNKKRTLLAIVVFVVALLAGTALGFGVRSYMRARNDAQQTAQNQPPAQPANQPSVNPDNSGPKVVEDPNLGEEESKPVEEKKPEKPKPVEAEPAKKPAEQEPTDKNPEEEVAETKKPPADNPPDDRAQIGGFNTGDDQGYLQVSFRLTGNAIVHIRGRDISVEPLNNSSVTDIQRSIRDPLPAERCQLSITRIKGQHDISVLERPKPRNGYTAAIVVNSPDYAQGRETTVSFGLGWRIVKIGERLGERLGRGGRNNDE